MNERLHFGGNTQFFERIRRPQLIRQYNINRAELGLHEQDYIHVDRHSRTPLSKPCRRRGTYPLPSSVEPPSAKRPVLRLSATPTLLHNKSCRTLKLRPVQASPDDSRRRQAYQCVQIAADLRLETGLDMLTEASITPRLVRTQ